MQGANAAEILAEYGLKPSDIVEWPASASNDPENLHRLARVAIMNRHLQTQSGCEPLVWKPMPPVEDPEEKKRRDEIGLLPAEWDHIKGHHGSVCGIGLSRHAYSCMLRKCRSQKALLLRGDGDKSRAFLLDALKVFAKASLLKALPKKNSAVNVNVNVNDLLTTAKELVRQAKQNPSLPLKREA